MRWGVDYVGRPAEGSSLVAITDRGAFASTDGGISWAETTVEPPETARQEVAFAYGRGRRTVETNGQTYVVDTPYVIGSGREVLYSYGYLQSPGNVWAQGIDKHDLTDVVLETEPTSYFYDIQTGNLILAMGNQGVVIVAPDGSSRRVAIGPYSPTDFSLRGKTKTLLAAILRPDSIGTNGAALLLAFTLAALVIAGPRAPTPAIEKKLLIGAGIAAVAALAVGVYPSADGVQHRVAGGLALLFSGYGAIPLLLVVAGLVRARPGVKLTAAIFAATLGILAVFLLGALVLFQFGLGVGNLFALGAAILVALAIWWWDQLRYWP